MTLLNLIRYVFFALVVYLFFLIVGRFIPSIVLAAVLAVLFYPLDRFFEKRLKIPPTFSGILTFLITFILIFGPLFLLLALIGRQAFLFAESFDPGKVKELADSFQTINVFGYRFELAQYQEQLTQFIKKMGESASGLVAGIGTNVGIFFLRFIAFALLYFYFLRDGEEIIRAFRGFMPLSGGQSDTLFQRFLLVSKTVLKGSVLSALLSGVVACLGFWLFGVRAPLIWGLLVAFLSLVPALGPLLVYLVGAVIVFIFQGWLIAVFFLAYFIGLEMVIIQNVIRPKLLDEKLSMHPIFVFFALVGGIEAFGSMGIIYGPLVAIAFITLLDFWRDEMRANRSKKSE